MLGDFFLMYVFIHRGKNLRRSKAINQVDCYIIGKKCLMYVRHFLL